MKANELVSKAVTTLVLDHPFFSVLLLQMPRVEDPRVPTACTDGVSIRYNPKFIESLSPGQVAGLFAHEVLHPALGHLQRLPLNREGNIAGDYAINNFLDNYNREIGARKLELPPGGLIDHKYDGMSCEEILAAYRRDNPPKPQQKQQQQGKGSGKPQGQSGNGQGQGEPEQGDSDSQSDSDGDNQSDLRTREEGGWGEFEKQAASDEVSADNMQAEWERRLVQAATVCKMRGNTPGCIEALVKHLVDPVVPWQQILNRFFDQTSANDYSWRKPDRRFLPEDIVVPDLHDETLGEIVIAVDTSGSIFSNRDALASFQAEINAIISRARPTRTHIVYCDAKVQHVDEYGEGEMVTIIPRGGGGTDFRPVGDWIAKHGITPRVCIYLTDLYGEFPDVEWPFPTIWCVYGNGSDTAPFGDTIRIND